MRRFSGEDGNAEIPGVLESINCINSVWRLYVRQCLDPGYNQGFAGTIKEFDDFTALLRSVCPDDVQSKGVSRLHVEMADRERSFVCLPW